MATQRLRQRCLIRSNPMSNSATTPPASRDLVAALGFERALDSVQAAASALHHYGKIAAIGYCWGGSVAFLANTRLGLPAVSYYGARTLPFAAEQAQAALLFHFGERDASIPPADIAAIHAAPITTPIAQAKRWRLLWTFWNGSWADGNRCFIGTGKRFRAASQDRS
jgi:dienelactone hydrolase